MRLNKQKGSQEAGLDPKVGSPVKASVSGICVRLLKEQQQTGEVHLHDGKMS
ncbi:hypothetical protein D3C71_1922640 [compost metagenome]